MTWCVLESLAKLFHGIAASATFLFGHRACRGLKMTLASHASACLGDHSHKETSYNLPNVPSNQWSPLPPTTFLLWAPYTSLGLVFHKVTCSFWFELVSLALAQESQSTPLTDAQVLQALLLLACSLPRPRHLAPGGRPCTFSRTCE